MLHLAGGSDSVKGTFPGLKLRLSVFFKLAFARGKAKRLASPKIVLVLVLDLLNVAARKRF